MDIDEFYASVRRKEHVRLLPSEAVSEGVDSILENYAEHFVSIEQFRALVRSAGQTRNLRPLSRKYAKYGIQYGSDPLDQFVAASMKRFDRQLYDSLKGKTKVPHLGRALSTLLKYCRERHTSETLRSNPLWSRCYDEALSECKSLFGGKKFQTLQLVDMFKQLPLDTTAGEPYRCKKSECLNECRKATIENYLKLTAGKKIEQRPCLLALRGHLSPLENIKTRPVWVNSFDNITLENILFRNVYDFVFSDALMQNTILTGPNVLSRLRNYLVSDMRNSFVNLDFSAWDTWPCRFAGRDLFAILRSVLDLKPGEDGVFSYVMKEFLDSILVLPDGSAVQKSSGTCTGSLLTSLFNSLMNWIVLRTVFKIIEVDYAVSHLMVLGDDAAFFVGVPHVERFVEEMSYLLAKLFGMKLNPSKCLVAGPDSAVEDRHFIGYTIRNDQLWRPEKNFFEYLLYVERPVDDVRTSFSRVVAYLLLGGISHTRFCQFVEQYMGHYRHVLTGDVLKGEVFRFGNLRVIKHVFQMEIDELIGAGFTVETLRSWDFETLPYRFTLGVGK